MVGVVGASTVVVEEAFTAVVAASMEAAVVVAVSTPEAVPQGEDSTRAAASKGEDSVPDLHRHRASGVEAIRARCPAHLRGPGQGHRQDLEAMSIVPLLGQQEANGLRFRRLLVV